MWDVQLDHHVAVGVALDAEPNPTPTATEPSMHSLHKTAARAPSVTNRARGPEAARCRAFLQPRQDATASSVHDVQQALSSTAIRLLLSLSLTLGPSACLPDTAMASQVRLEDVESPRMQV